MKFKASWKGKRLTVDILHSQAGVAQQLWIANVKGAILVDSGDGTLRDILKRDLNYNRLQGILFTHGHFDHVSGLHALLGFLRMVGKEEPLPIFAPEGCNEVLNIVDAFLRSYPDTIPFDISLREISDQEVLHLCGMEIKAFSVVHCGSIEKAGILGPIPALGYRISYQGESIAISGDTGLCPSLKPLIRGADLAILDATYKTNAEAGRKALRNVHLSEEAAGELGKLAKDYILVHKGERH